MPNPTKLMLDAFKGTHKASVVEGSQIIVEGVEMTNKTRKALLFEDSAQDAHGADQVKEDVQIQENEQKGELKAMGEMGDIGAVAQVPEEDLHSQALDEANLMVEGFLLSDSELLVEEGDDLEDWEQGEITDFMEEDELAGGDQNVGEKEDVEEPQDETEAQVEIETQVDEAVGGDAKKKGEKNGANAVRDPPKKRADLHLSSEEVIGQGGKKGEQQRP